MASLLKSKTSSDLCDRNLDRRVERCKERPLPAGMITVPEAVAAFVAWLPLVVAITYTTLGEAGVLTFLPIWGLSLIYPFMKRLVPFPQVILGAIIGAAVFPGWAAITGDLGDLGNALPLFAATMSWVVYFDIFYAIQVLQSYPRITGSVANPTPDTRTAQMMQR